MKFRLSLALVGLSLLAAADGQTICQKTDIKSCRECISLSNQCFWCADLGIPSDQSRCNSHDFWRQTNCENIVGDKAVSGPTIQENREFSDKMDKTVQLRPQKIELSMRAESEVTIPIRYKQATDYPMDLYYLMDLSCTMLRYKESLASVGQRLAQTMKKTTRNFRIGFGSYVDKPLMPYSAFKIEPIECSVANTGLRDLGEPPYSYKHRLSLTSDEAEFVEKVRRSKTSGNTDSPEGLLDALMQVLVCNKHIGWRNQSDKIIVVATDEDFHYAGDGKLAGIITPNDGRCHMSDDGNYTHYHLQDYPSMHQIAEKGNRFNIVFTVANRVKPTYETLAKIIGSTARVALLQEDDNTVVQLIQEVYNNIRSAVELKVEKIPDNIEVELYSKCQNNRLTKTSKCSYTSNKESIEFEARIKLKSCPEPGKPKPTNAMIKIGLANNINENLEINLNMLCNCDCEKRVDRNSKQCSTQGSLSCGTCECYGIRTGADCSCDPEEPIDPKDPTKHCRTPNSTSICNNRGTCECGSCANNCQFGYSGKLCQFDESECYPNNDKSKKKCSGKGVCVEAKCNCIAGYTGKSCDCPLANSTCVTGNDGEVCSGRGDCICGKCNCNTSKATGELCQFCPSCEDKKYCNQTFECVPQVCKALYGSADNCTQSCDFDYSFVDVLKEENQTSGVQPFKYQCHQRTLDNECDISFIYERTDDEQNNRKIFRITKPVRNCKERVNLVVVSGGVAAGILLVGLALLLIWKLLTEIWDRREYARFQKEVAKTNWEQNENPLYKEAKTTFTNPMFGNLRDRATKRLSRFTERFSRRFDGNN